MSMATQEELRSSLPIDRGWAWVITFASCGLFVFSSGSIKSQGVILVELQELYPDYSASSLLWIFSLCFLISRLSGPINGFILSKTSNRFISVLGIILVTVSLIIFAHLPRVEYMYPVYGVGFGIGAGLIHLSVYTAYTPYFNKKKALSLGVTSSGSGIGMLLTPNLLRFLFDNYSFSGAMLIYAGVALQTLVLATLLRPISFYEQLAERKHVHSRKQLAADRAAVQENDGMKSIDYLAVNEDNFRRRSLSVGGHKKLSTKYPLEESAIFLSMPNNIDSQHDDFNQQPLSRLEIALSNHELAFSLIDLPRSSAGLENDSGVERAPEGKENKSTSFDWRLAYNPQCVLLGLTMLAHVAGISVTFQAIPPFGKESGISKELVAILLAAGGLFEIPMRIGNGWLADKRFISAYTHLTLCMLITGLSALLCAILSGLAGITVMLVGLFSGGTSVFSLLPLACGEILGNENIRTATAINFAYQGVAAAISTFCVGAIVDYTQQWRDVFYYIGACNMLGSSIMLITSIRIHYIRKRRQQETMHVELTR